METRPVTADEAPAFIRSLGAAFHNDVPPEDVETIAAVLEPARTLAVLDEGDIVATAAIYSRELTVPGAVVPAAGVTLVGARPTHRRRGLVTELMRRQLADARAAGEAVAALWASEAAIYGRFGYGLAARHADLRLRTAGARLRAAAPEPGGRMTLLEPSAAVPLIAPVYDRVRRTRPGHLDRAGAWWRRRTFDPESGRQGRGPLRAAVHEAPDGTVDGYVLYAVKTDWGDDGPSGEVGVRELLADGPAANAAVWAFLLGLDLTRTVTYGIGPADEPLELLVEGPQRARAMLSPNLWVRLVDVAAALAARTYAAPLEVVLQVEDAFCPWNASRYRLEASEAGGAAHCARTDAAPDLELGATELGAAYLGGTTLAGLAALGRVREVRRGSLARASVAFRGVREPWCPEIF